MKPRERLLAALDLRETDRVPISTHGLVGFDSRAWENQEPSYARLMALIRERTDCVCMWKPGSNQRFLASSAPVEEDVEERREGATTVTRRTVHTPKGDLSQTIRVVDDVHTVWQTEHWCKTVDDVDRALSVPYVPLEFDTSDYERIVGEVGDNGIILASLAGPMYMAADLIAFGDFTVWAMTETKHFARTVEVMHERNLENLRRMLDACVVDLYRIYGPEYATPPFLSPAMFERFVVPYVREMVDLIHSRGAKVRLHCHGRIGRVLELIAATGVDGLDACEAPPDGDALGEVKQRLGQRTCVFGNLELRLLETGSGPEVQEAVRQCMEAAKPGGGYVIVPAAEPIDVPLAPKTEENYLWFVDAALSRGRY